MKKQIVTKLAKENKFKVSSLGEVATISDVISEIPTIMSGTVEKIDDKHFLMKLGCKTFVAHNCHELAEIVEKSCYEYFRK